MQGHTELVAGVVDEILAFASQLGSIEQKGDAFALLDPSSFDPPAGFYAADHLALLCFDIVQVAIARDNGTVQYPTSLGPVAFATEPRQRQWE